MLNALQIIPYPTGNFQDNPKYLRLIVYYLVSDLRARMSIHRIAKMSLSPLRLPAYNLISHIPRRAISTTIRGMAANTNRSEAGQVISEVSKQEGGTYKGKMPLQTPLPSPGCTI